MLQRLDAVILIVVPVLFWIGTAYGLLVGMATSHPHFMASATLSRCYSVVAVLFAVNLAHILFGIPFLFGGPFADYLLLTLVMSAFLVFVARRDRARLNVDISGDPRLKKCPRCGSVMDIIVAECPKCESPV